MSLTTTTVRRQGGAAIMTIPAAALKALGIGVGASLIVEVEGDTLVVRAIERRARRRYSTQELLRGATTDALDRLAAETDWAREGDPVGREL